MAEFSTRDLDRVVQFRRYTESTDDFGSVQVWADHGAPVWAAKKDASDAERWRADEVSAMITARFRVHYSTFSAGLTPKDRLTCEGVEFDITGIKEVGPRRRWLEITASARADQ